MKAFGSNPDSPPLGKMEGGSRYEGRRSKGFSFGRIVGDPFALATISIAILAWLIAFVSSIITDVDTYYPRFAWWALVYMLFVIIGIMVAVGSDSVYTYHVAITGFLAAGLLLTSSAVDNLVYSPDGAAEASAAGFILLSMVAIVWIFYFGSQPQASHRAFVDSFALGKGERDLNSTRSSRPMSNNYMGQPNAPQGGQPQQQIYNSQLNGFETSSPITGYGSNSQQARDSQSRYTNSAIPSQVQNGQQMSNVPISGTTDNDVSAPADYPYRAKAIYSYEANPEDANEISFQKHEILEVSDVSGRWWQAKKATGETGIAPSNYLILL